MSGDLLKLAAVLGLVAANGLFVAAEFALVSARRTRIDQLAESGNRMARTVQKAMDDPNRFISASQVGITMASLALGWIAEPAMSAILNPIFEPIFGEHSPISAHVVSAIVAYFIITLLHIVLGEQVPKMIALQRSESTILATAGPISWLAVPFRPLISLLYWLTSLVLRPLKLEWQGEHHLVYTEDELKLLVTASQQSGKLDVSERELINRVFGFADVMTQEIMVHRTEMAALPIGASLDEVTQSIAESGHARYPVFGENLDDILGIVYVKDLYRYLSRGPQQRFALSRFMRPKHTVSEVTPIDNLLTYMKANRIHIAIVADEYGGTAGMVTLEDVLEWIVGDVQDEFEKPDIEVEELENGEIAVSGSLSISDFKTRFELELDEPFYNTIGGYVFGQIGRRPEVGDEVPINSHILRVDRMDGVRIDRLIMSKAPDVPTDDAELQAIPAVES